MPGAAFSYMDTAPGVVTLTASNMMMAAAADTAMSDAAGAEMTDASNALTATKVVTPSSPALPV